MFGNAADPRWPPGPKSPREYRIAMIGGSTVFRGKPALPALLENAFLRHGFKGVKVYNLGIVSQKSGQELAQLIFDVVDAKPDLVIIYDGGNDVMDPMYLDPRPNFPMDFLVYENNPLMADLKSYPAVSLFLFGSALVRHFFSNRFKERLLHLSDIRRRADYGSDSWRQEIADSYIGNLIKSRAIAHAFGAQLIVVFQPLVYFKAPLGPVEAHQLRPQWRDHASDVRGRIIERLGRPERAAGLRFLNLSEAFNGIDKDVFEDFIHIRQEYQGLLAEKIFRALEVRNAAGRPSVSD